MSPSLQLNLSNGRDLLVLSKIPLGVHPSQELDVIGPDRVALNVEPHPVQGEVVGLSHLLLVGRESGLGFLDVEEVGFPQVNAQHSDQTSAEELNQGPRCKQTET